jgi:hypothetical protein
MEPERLLRCGHGRAAESRPICEPCLLESDKSRGLGQRPILNGDFFLIHFVLDV